jgi:hypothetical protein
MVVVIKKEALRVSTLPAKAKALAGISVGLAALMLAGCANVSSVQPGTPVTQVIKQYGNPDINCPSRDGGKRMVWTQQQIGRASCRERVSSSG